MSDIQPVLIAGQWKAADVVDTFQADNPATKQSLPAQYPVSAWSDCEAALAAADEAFPILAKLPPERIAAFLTRFAELIEANADALCEIANAESALPISPRLKDVELPRTANQLRAAAAAAVERSWKQSTIDTKTNIRAYFAPLGPVCVFGPNNFPFAFGSASGGDFAAAIAAGNPVIAKANPSCPGTTYLMAKLAFEAVQETDLPPATVQLIYHCSYDDGVKLVSDPRIGATAYTGSRRAGLVLKEAADKHGKPIYLELSSVNPVVILPGALKERGDKLVDEFSGSCLMGTGQFCTNPGLVLLIDSAESQKFVTETAAKFAAAPVGTLLSKNVETGLTVALQTLKEAGAEELAGGAAGAGAGYSHANTLLKVDAAKFLTDPEVFQTEAFGNGSLIVVAKDLAEAIAVIDSLEGNLTGCVYSDTQGSDDAAYAELEPHLRVKVGRLLNDKMPTGVAVSPAMNHGGPFPATAHPGFTAVGIPAALIRFGMLQCFDNVRAARLPAELQDKNPTGKTWRLIDGVWTTGDVAS
ncbi:aldehyde dehydrogenase (NADP(+)) [Blastopirellula marina]|uniref:Ketoglutarate semialdehyde dehydrogenase n=1 Tax=Blastopirellula marina TaxID=124 RepID=A0A2S8FF49_9BACT|nr:aldehyde dehydrogenase (NADP(+)) [Blastopirellula marina]PQO30789.1 ketoglutarate semialdehyde dehydrogenase [Blastopirellula marina]PTL42642.1 aldehyde dehydrogenase (NADP(+)) [Blastopirellula marina]